MLSFKSFRSTVSFVTALVLPLLGSGAASASLASTIPLTSAPWAAGSGGFESGQKCTIVYVADNDVAMAGNNEDWTGLFSKIHILPARKGKLGMVLFGFDEVRTSEGRIELVNAQGGMNEQGLFFDGASAEDAPELPDSLKAQYDHEACSLIKALEVCSTVDEVLEYIERYHCLGSHNGQFLIGDRFGNSAIIEPSTVVRKTGRYQVVTNFLQSRTPPEEVLEPRYLLATKLLEESEEVSVDLLRRVVSAVHWEEYSGSMTVTLYSYICDLKRREVYVYNFHDFEQVAKIKLRDELAKGESVRTIASLFPYETFAERRYKAWRIVDLLRERAVQEGLEGPGGMIAYYHELCSGKDASTRYDVHERQLLAAGYRLLKEGNTELAIGIFRFTVSEHAESALGYRCLGDAYAAAGDKELAIRSYEKVLELDPGDDSVSRMLEDLRR